MAGAFDHLVDHLGNRDLSELPVARGQTWYLNPDSSVQHGNVFDNDALKALETGTEKKVDGFSMIIPNAGSPATLPITREFPRRQKGLFSIRQKRTWLGLRSTIISRR